MKIVQLSDLHIDSSFKFESYQDMLQKAIEILQKEIESEKHIYIVVCGDIVSKGTAPNYKKAKVIMDYFKRLKQCRLHFLFVPGNHDLCEKSFKDFDAFIKSYNKELSFDGKNINIREYDDIRFILLNTTYQKNYEYGSFNKQKLD